jgi:hypothetical protein
MNRWRGYNISKAIDLDDSALLTTNVTPLYKILGFFNPVIFISVS